MDVDDHDAAPSVSTAAVGAGAAAVISRGGWAVVNMDSQHHTTVLVTRWRWYAAWWAGWLRISEGNDMKIVRTR